MMPEAIGDTIMSQNLGTLGTLRLAGWWMCFFKEGGVLWRADVFFYDVLCVFFCYFDVQCFFHINITYCPWTTLYTYIR